jgi:hypothetical protein
MAKMGLHKVDGLRNKKLNFFSLVPMYLKRRSSLSMSLSPILGAASQVLSLFGSGSTTSSSSSTPATSTDPLSILDSSGNVNLSQAAQVFSKLQDLSQSNPAQFKQLTAQISSQLQTDAQQASGTTQTFLSNLASQFNTASQTGSTSALQPQTAETGGHHGHGHGHHHSSSQAAYDLASQTTDAQSTAAGTVQSIFQQLQGL